MMLIQFMGHLEENVAMMFSNSGGRERGPGGVAGGGLDARRVLGFVFEPTRHMLEERLLSQRFAEERFQFRGQRGPLDGDGLFLGDAGDSALLDEFTFEGEQRRERVVAGGERLDLAGDTEKLAQEIFQMRREFDDEFGLILGGDGFGVGAGVGQARVEVGVGGGQMVQKNVIQTHQSFAAVEVLKEDAKA